MRIHIFHNNLFFTLFGMFFFSQTEQLYKTYTNTPLLVCGGGWGERRDFTGWLVDTTLLDVQNPEFLYRNFVKWLRDKLTLSFFQLLLTSVLIHFPLISRVVLSFVVGDERNNIPKEGRQASVPQK